MKYFTPELIARGQSDDSRVLDEVEALWEKRCVQYNTYLTSICDELSPGLRYIKDNYYLHDATIRVVGHRRDQLIIVLQLDTPPRSLLTFTYHLLEPPRIDSHNLPEASCPPRDVANSLGAFLGGSLGIPKSVCSRVEVVEWQYDEVEKVDGEPPTWRQSILLSNGWEIVIHFREVEVSEMQAVLPTPSNDAPPWMPACLP